MIEKGKHILSLNFMPEEIQASWLRIKLKNLPKWNQQRRKIASLYKKELTDLPIKLPQEAKNCYHVYHHFVISTPKRNKLQEFLQKEGIQTQPYYPIPLHLQPAFKHLGYKKGDFSEAEKAAKEVLSLPIHPHLKKSEALFVCQQIKKFFRLPAKTS